MLKNKSPIVLNDQYSAYMQYIKCSTRYRDTHGILKNLEDNLNLQYSEEYYVKFLRSVYFKGLSGEQNDFLKKNHEYYEKFSVAVKELKKELEIDKKKQYLGGGANGKAYLLSIDGKKYVAKFSNKEKDLYLGSLHAYIRGIGVKEMAQIQAYSFEDDVIILEYIQGDKLNKLIRKNHLFDDEILSKIISLLINLYDRGIYPDIQRDHLFYHNGEIKIIDPCILSERNITKDGKGGMIFDLMTLYVYLNNNNDYSDFVETDNFLKTQEGIDISLLKVEQFLKIIQKEYDYIFDDYKNIYLKENTKNYFRSIYNMRQDYSRKNYYNALIKKYLKVDEDFIL